MRSFINASVRKYWKFYMPMVISAAIVGALMVLPTYRAFMLTVDNPAAGASSYKVGETVVLTGAVNLADGETRNITSVALDMGGPMACDATLPIAPGANQSVACEATGTGSLSVDVSYSGVAALTESNSGYGYGYGYGYVQGSGNAAKINYTIRWNSPVWISPMPTFSLVPQTVSIFTIPANIPTPTPVAGLPVELPNSELAFTIPALTEEDENAPDELPTLTVVGAIPLLTESVSSVPPIPENGGDFDNDSIVGTLPTVGGSSIVGIGEFPSSTSFLSTSDEVAGMDTDSSGNIYVVVDGSGADQVKKYTAAGVLDTTWATNGVLTLSGLGDAQQYDQNDYSITNATSIAVAGGFILVGDATNQAFGDNNTDNLGWGYVIHKFDETTAAYQGSSEACSVQQMADNDSKANAMAGDGTRFWVFIKGNWDDRLKKIKASDCSEVEGFQYNSNDPIVANASGIAATSTHIYMSDASGNIKKYLKSGISRNLISIKRIVVR